MNIVLKKIKILDKNSTHYGKTVDLHIKSGIIQKIGRNITAKGAKVLTFENAHASIGFVDIGTQIGEPGFEQREDITSVSNAAAAGGYTAIASFPNTSPVIQSKSEIEYIKTKSQSQLVDILPIGAISKETKGEGII